MPQVIKDITLLHVTVLEAVREGLNKCIIKSINMKPEKEKRGFEEYRSHLNNGL